MRVAGVTVCLLALLVGSQAALPSTKASQAPLQKPLLVGHRFVPLSGTEKRCIWQMHETLVHPDRAVGPISDAARQVYSSADILITETTEC